MDYRVRRRLAGQQVIETSSGWIFLLSRRPIQPFQPDQPENYWLARGRRVRYFPWATPPFLSTIYHFDKSLITTQFTILRRHLSISEFPHFVGWKTNIIRGINNLQYIYTYLFALPVPDPPCPGGGVRAKFYVSYLYYVTYTSCPIVRTLSFTHLWAVIPPMRFAVNASLPIDYLLSFHTFQYMLLSTYSFSLVPC